MDEWIESQKTSKQIYDDSNKFKRNSIQQQSEVDLASGRPNKAQVMWRDGPRKRIVESNRIESNRDNENANEDDDQQTAE